MKKHWRKLAFAGLLLIILIFIGARNDSILHSHAQAFLEAKANSFVNSVIPQGWGAVADGVHNDAAAIQAAIDSGAAEIFLPNLNPNAKNPGKVASTNYYLGATSLTITKPICFRMAVGTSLVYTGPDAPLIVDCRAGAIEGLVLYLYDVYTSGSYCLKVVGDGATPGTTAYVARATISGHRLAGFKAAGLFTKWCMFVENDLDFMNMYADVNAPNAWGYYFDPADQAAKMYIHEANRIHSLTVNSRRALYGGGTHFDQNNINIGTDYGSLSFDGTQDNMIIGGPQNIITINAFNVDSPLSSLSRVIHFLPAARGNIYICPPLLLSGIVDEAPIGSNTFQSPRGRINYLKNSSFESWNSSSALPDWDLNCKVAPTTTYVRHGKKGIAITSSNGHGNISQALPDELIGQDLIFCGWFKSPATNTGKAAFGFSDSNGSHLVALPNDGLFHFLALPYSPPVGVTGMRAQLFADLGRVNQTIFADGLVVTTGSIPVMPDGDPDKALCGTAAWNPTNVVDGAVTSIKVGCLGAVVGDPVSVGFSTAVPARAILSGSVTATDTVTVTLLNKTGAPLHLKPGILRVEVRKNE
jgi:hypothetical protein